MATPQFRTETFQKLFEDAENLFCFDCKKEEALYASVSHGIFLCQDCADLHRTFGVHISFVKGVRDNSWTLKQLKIMRVGGNSAFRIYLSKYPFGPGDTEGIYRSRATKAYRDMIKQLAEGAEWIDVDCSVEEGVMEYVEPPPSYVPPQPQEAPRSWRSYFTSAVAETKKISGELASKTKELIAHPAVEELKGKTKAVISTIGSKGKEIADNPAVQSVTTSASDYFLAAKTRASETLHRISENPTVQSTKTTVMEKLNSFGEKASETLQHLRSPGQEESKARDMP